MCSQDYIQHMSWLPREFATWSVGNRIGKHIMASTANGTDGTQGHLVTSTDPDHPANLICTLCRNFYSQGWVTGTGGGISIVKDDHIFIAPSGVQKELL